jgi:hypothetical protein
LLISRAGACAAFRRAGQFATPELRLNAFCTLLQFMSPDDRRADSAQPSDATVPALLAAISIARPTTHVSGRHRTWRSALLARRLHRGVVTDRFAFVRKLRFGSATGDAGVVVALRRMDERLARAKPEHGTWRRLRTHARAHRRRRARRGEAGRGHGRLRVFARRPARNTKGRLSAALGVCTSWRPHGDSNPGRYRERVMS